MKWVKSEKGYKVPIQSWCEQVEDGALSQAADLASHPAVYHHVALMPDCHQGYGMPIGGVIACQNAVIPNAVGVDIGCGMGAVETNISVSATNQRKLRGLTELIKESIPCGEGKAHHAKQSWDGFNEDIEEYADRGWFTEHAKKLANRNLGTLGGGNHFIEVQGSEEGFVWLMIHSGSRNLGHTIATYYNKLALELNKKWNIQIPNKDLAFFPADSPEGQSYVKDMTLALNYAWENRRRIMNRFMDAFRTVFSKAEFKEPINIHHNYAALENHFHKNVWIHRKGATSAKKDEIGIIPGSMGAPSYIVKGLGAEESFTSCSHGAGRKMSRMQASRSLTTDACDKAMGDVVFDRWKKLRRGKSKGMRDLGEAPQAYKDIDAVIQAQSDLIEPIVKLHPLAVVKG